MLQGPLPAKVMSAIDRIRQECLIRRSLDGEMVILRSLYNRAWQSLGNTKLLADYPDLTERITAELAFSDNAGLLIEVPVQPFPTRGSAVCREDAWFWDNGQGTIERIGVVHRVSRVDLRAYRGQQLSGDGERRAPLERVVGGIENDNTILGPVNGDPLSFLVRCSSGDRVVRLVVKKGNGYAVLGMGVERPAPEGSLRMLPYPGLYTSNSLIAIPGHQGEPRIFHAPRL